MEPETPDGKLPPLQMLKRDLNGASFCKRAFLFTDNPDSTVVRPLIQLLLPRNRLSFSEKPTRGSAIRQGGQPHGCICPLFWRQRSRCAPHVCFDPTGAIILS
jgi:hypothetical protein